MLLVLIALVAIFHSNSNSTINKVHEKVKELEKLIKNLQTSEIVIPKHEEKEVKKQITEQNAPQIKPVVLPNIIPPLVKEIKKEEVPAEDKITGETVKHVAPGKEKVMAFEKEKTQPKIIAPPQPSWSEKFKANNPDLEKFIGENLISKIGVAILVLGIGFFVKYAIDKDWINEIARTGIGILCGVIVMGFAHKLRKNFKAFSSVLVSGAIAIFYFTIAIAFHEYHLFSQTVAFAIMLVITAFSVFISVSYNRMELAALSLVGGFATPFMVSTGEGNYIVLFTYIMILNIGMLVLAYLKKWNLINILSYVFTILLFGIWLGTKVIGVTNAPYKGALLFGSGFYLTFILMNIVNNVKARRSFSGIELSILLSNTFLFYGADMAIFQYYHNELKGAFTISLALFNFVCSWFLFRNFKADKKLVYLLIGLTLTFVTLAAPVQLKGNYITLFWAVEAVLLLWLSQRSKIVQFRFAAVIVHILMLGSLLIDWAQVYSGAGEITLPILLNKGFITGIVSTLAMLGTLFILKNEKENTSYLGIQFNPKIYSGFIKVTAIIVFYLTGFLELFYQANVEIISMASIGSLLAAYHLAYCTVLIYFLMKHKKTTGAFVMSLANVILFAFVFSQLPFTELKERLTLEHGCRLAFAFHYISLACVIYMHLVLHKISNSEKPFLPPARRAFVWLSCIFILYLASSELMLHGLTYFTSGIPSGDSYLVLVAYEKIIMEINKIGFPILWGLLAFAFLAFGIKKQSKDFRVASLLLLAITILKLFVYDIQNVSEGGKIVAFIILGVVLLIMSFMYQKIKALILTDESHKKSETQTDEIN